jgi:L-threonylcarbamoyladenylate synthase
LNQGSVILYPTEAVFGLGCDPDNEQAVMDLLAIKQRSVDKGLILIADNYSQLLPYIDDVKIPMDKRPEIFSSWPGAVTWILPAATTAPKWLTGKFDTIAVRVTNHTKVKKLCLEFGKPLVSTSANLTGCEPVKNITEAKIVFSDKNLFYVDGELGLGNKPSQIKSGLTGAVIRN